MLQAGYLLAEPLPGVVILTTGGTIASKYSVERGAVIPQLTGSELVKAVPQLADIASIKVIEHVNLDSSHMTPEIWAGISLKVDKILQREDIKGVVVTHGTDTIAEGAYFLELTLKSNKPVVFVGAMRGALVPSADGPSNILDAVRQVCSSEAKGWPVTVTMNHHIHAANRVVKVHTHNVQAFNSGKKGCLGYISMGKVERYNNRSSEFKLPVPKVLPRVELLKTFAGDDGSLLRSAVDSGAKGIVIEGVGAGNVNPSVADAIDYAMQKQVIVVLCTAVHSGGVIPVYGEAGGGAILARKGVIMGGDLPGEKARILLMLAIPETRGNVNEIQKYFLI